MNLFLVFLAFTGLTVTTAGSTGFLAKRDSAWKWKKMLRKMLIAKSKQHAKKFHSGWEQIFF